MSILFVSDIHLASDRPVITAIFLRFLKQQAAKAQTLYILGDLFEAWVGDDDLNPFNQQIIDGLKQLTATGVAVFFLHGNRDFLIGPQFAALTGCQLLPELQVIDLYGQPTLIMHGDTLCTADKDYLAFRAQGRNPLFQQEFLSKPIPMRYAIAQQLRAASKEHTSLAAADIMDVTPSEVLKVMAEQGVNDLIHGHTHRPGMSFYGAENSRKCRMVLADWEYTGHVLSCEGAGQYRTYTLV